MPTSVRYTSWWIDAPSSARHTEVAGLAQAMTFAKKLRSLREALHWSRAELAQRAKIPRRTLAQYEQGQREPRWTTFVMLASALGSPLEEFRECVVAAPRTHQAEEETTSPQLRRSKP